MPPRPKATTLLSRTILGFSLRSCQGWWQPQLFSHSSFSQIPPLYCLQVICRSGDRPARQVSSHTAFLLRGYDAREVCWEVGRGDAMAGAKVCGVGGELVSCMPNSTGYLSKNRVERVVLSAMPSRRFHSTVLSKAEGVVAPQPLVLETVARDATGPTDESLPQDSHSPSEPSDGHRRRNRAVRRYFPCEYETCKVKVGNYGFPDGQRTRCKRHQLPGMVIFYNGCKVQGCNTVAAFNFPGEQTMERCKAHRLEGMVNRTRPLCKESECTRMAEYGPEGEKSPSVCRYHAVEGMISIYPYPNLQCRSPGCLAKGTHSLLSDKRHRFCVEHRSKDMASLSHTRCEERGCTRMAKFGWESIGVWLRCSDHQLKGMVRSHRCTAEDCSKVPSFGYPGDKVPSRCRVHMEEGMEHLQRKLTCDVEKCERNAYYAFRGEQASRCLNHKDAEMVNVAYRPCEVSGCEIRAQYGVPGRPRTRCGRHKEQGMTRLKQRSEGGEALVPKTQA